MTLPTPKQQYLDYHARECATTMRVLRAMPVDHIELRPHAMCKTARELAWQFAGEQGLTEMVITTGLDMEKMASGPAMPESWEDVLRAFEQAQTRVAQIVRDMPDDRLMSGTVKFFTAPRTVSDMPTMQFLWAMLCDQIHHRGQFSIYLRMAGGRVPSIYGPTADEPWN
jgi:uncharacterized damage-inducible protein DinB